MSTMKLFLYLSLFGLFVDGAPASTELYDLDLGACFLKVNNGGGPFNHWIETPFKDRVKPSGDKYFFIYRDGSLSTEELTCDNVRATFAPTDQPPSYLRSILLAPAADPNHGPTIPDVKKVSTSGQGQKNLVVMIQWKDQAVSDIPMEGYDVLFNHPVGQTDATYAPTGSVKNFFNDQSGGKLLINSTLSGWIMSSYTEAQASGGYNCHGVCTDPNFTLQRAIMEAIQKYEEIVGGDAFAEYDQDGDGYVDMFTIIHSGRPAEVSGAGPYTIWSHQYSLITSSWDSSQWGYTAPISGLKFFQYNINAGRWKNTGTGISHLGVIVHELTHYLGLEDYYDTDFSSKGVGMFDYMSNPWGPRGDQQYFSSLSPCSKYQLGWIGENMTTVGSVGGTYVNRTFDLPSFQETGSVLVIDLGDQEMVMIENRRPVGLDKYLYGGGILVWHCFLNHTTSSGTLISNDVELDPSTPSSWAESHPTLRLVQADNDFDLEYAANSGESADFFNSGKYIDDTVLPLPNINSYKNLGNPSNISIYGLSDSADVMTVRIVIDTRSSVPSTIGTPTAPPTEPPTSISSPPSTTPTTPIPTSTADKSSGGGDDMNSNTNDDGDAISNGSNFAIISTPSLSLLIVLVYLNL